MATFYRSKYQNKHQHNPQSVFAKVEYSVFRQHLADIATRNVESQGFETVIYDKQGDIQAIVHAASIDNHGRCFPAEYFILRRAIPATSMPVAA